ncbi:MAG: diguanylate cyclase [Polyangiaceae bacterium]
MTAPLSTPHHDATHGARVLFVDDEPTACRAFARSMRSHGWDVTTETDPERALELARQSTFELVVSDLRMPAMDGLTFMARLHAERPQTIFLLVTAVAHLDLASNQLVDGAIASVISKPWDEATMNDLLVRAAGIQEARAARDPQSSRPPKPESVLIVEDDATDAAIVKLHLAQDTSVLRSVDVVNRLDRALLQLRARSYDVAIVDLSLPDARGLDAVGHMRRAAPNTALIVHSGHEDEGVALHALQLGAQDVLAKSRVTPPLLNRTIRFAIERKRTQQRLANLAHFDQLTGLANRTTLHDRVEHATSMARRRGDELALLYVDLDGFKKVNDTHGHETGDALLQQVADRLRNVVRDCDTVARLGGDEFAILLEDTNGRPDIPAQRVVETLGEPFVLGDVTVSVSGSVGVAVFPSAGDTVEDLLRSADEAMYEAKVSGKGRMSVAAPIAHSRSTTRVRTLIPERPAAPRAVVTPA